MAMRLQLEPWGRLPDLTSPPTPPRRERSSLAWAVPYWLVAVGFAYAVHADWFPVGSWMESLVASSRAGAPGYGAGDLEPSEPPPLIDDGERRRSAMGVFTDDGRRQGDPWGGEPDWEPVAALDDQQDDEPADDAPQEQPEADDEPLPKEVAATSDDAAEHREGRTRARPTAEPRSQGATAPVPVAAAGDGERTSSPTGSADVLTRRARKLALAVDQALGSARPRPGTEDAGGESTPRVRRRARGSPSKSMSCEAAIAAYNEQWAMDGNRGPRDISAEQYGAVLNSGAYFGHCGVPSSMGVSICAAVQDGRAVGVTVTTSPRSNEVRRCIASAVRGLAFPSHPRMDVTTTVFKPVR